MVDWGVAVDVRLVVVEGSRLMELHQAPLELYSLASNITNPRGSWHSGISALNLPIPPSKEA